MSRGEIESGNRNQRKDWGSLKSGEVYKKMPNANWTECLGTGTVVEYEELGQSGNVEITGVDKESTPPLVNALNEITRELMNDPSDPRISPAERTAIGWDNLKLPIDPIP